MPIVQHPGRPQLSLSGEIDLAVSGELRTIGLEVADQLTAGEDFEIDVAGVTFIDSSGLGALISIRNVANRSGGAVVLVHPSAALLRTFELGGLRGVFEFSEVP